MSYVLRLELPDRPGALGAVATALGVIEVDILAMDIVERSSGNAVDDLVVELPRNRAPDALITAAESVPGVRVESIRPDPGIADAHREWELTEALAADPEHAVETLAELLPDVLRTGWAAVVRVAVDRTVEVLAGGGGVGATDPADGPGHRRRLVAGTLACGRHRAGSRATGLRRGRRHRRPARWTSHPPLRTRSARAPRDVGCRSVRP